MRQAGPRFSGEVDGVMTPIVIADWARAGTIWAISEHIARCISRTSGSRFTARSCAWPARDEINSSRSSLHLLNLAKEWMRGWDGGDKRAGDSECLFYWRQNKQRACVLMTVQVSTWIMHRHYFEISTIDFLLRSARMYQLITSVSLWSLL